MTSPLLQLESFPNLSSSSSRCILVYNCFTNLLPGTCPAVVKTQTHPQPEHDSARPRPSTSPQRTAQPKIASKMSAHKRKEAPVKSLRKKLKTRETTSLNGFNGFWLLKR